MKEFFSKAALATAVVVLNAMPSSVAGQDYVESQLTPQSAAPIPTDQALPEIYTQVGTDKRGDTDVPLYEILTEEQEARDQMADLNTNPRVRNF